MNAPVARRRGRRLVPALGGLALRPARRWLLVILLAHLLLGLAYEQATPIFEAPDEGYHFAVIRWIAWGRGLPVQRVGEPGDWEQEGSQPPLYHALAAALTAWIDTSDWETVYVRNPFLVHEPGTPQNVNFFRHTANEDRPYQGTALAVHVARWFSLALSLVTVWLIYRLSLAVFPAREWQALLAAGLAAFIPQVLFINAAVNNDNLLMLLASAALLLVVEVMRAPVRRYPWKVFVLGVLLGLAALTKLSGLVLWPVAALGLAWGAHCARSWRRLWTGFLLAGLPALLLSGWWYWRNQALYGEWLGLQTMVAIAGPRTPPVALLQLILQEGQGFYWSLWGVFGVFTILPGHWLYLFFTGLVLVAIAGGAVAMLRSRGRPSTEALLLALYCCLTLAGVVRWSMQTPASQGRLMFGALGPLTVFMAAGIMAAARLLLESRAGRQWARATALALGGVLALVAAAVPVAYVAPAYARPPIVPEAELPPELRPVQAHFGDGIELIGYTAADAPVVPGDELAVTLYWRALAPMTADYELALHLLGRERAEVGKLDTWPGGGLAPTSQWQPGTIFADAYVLPVDSDARAPSLLRLDLYFWEDDPAQSLPIRAPDGSPLESVTLEVGRLVTPEAPKAVPEYAEGSTFEHGLRLAGYDVGPGEALYLALYWDREGQAPVPQDYTVFAHLVDEQGVLISQADGPPLGADWPTSAWMPGQRVVDERLIELPPELPPGRFFLRLGLYEPVSGARLAAFAPDGTRWPDDMVVVPLVGMP